MTERMRSALIEWAKLIGAAAVITSVASSVLSFVVTVAFFVWGAQILAAAGVATSDEMAAVKSRVDDLLSRVVVLARPERIAHYRDLPIPVGGQCYGGEECSISIYVERDLRALECRVIPGLAQLLVTQDSRTFAVPIITRNDPVNVGSSPRALEPTFLLPRSVESGEVSAHIETHYTNCLWQTNGQPPVVESSPQFKIKIGEMP